MRKKIGVWILTIMMLATMIPQAAFVSAAETGEAGSGTSTGKRVADPSTMDNWETYFGTDDNFSTTHAGHVWTDKTVLKEGSDLSYAKDSSTQNKSRTITLNGNDENNFLVALSAMASSEYKVGQSNKPTDTMIVLDLSSSMYSEYKDGKIVGGNSDTVKSMIDAVNKTITDLQNLNPNNRVGVTVYYGGSNRLPASAESSTLMLPLDRYEINNEYLEVTTYENDSNKIWSVDVNNDVKNSQGQSVDIKSRKCGKLNAKGEYESIIAGTYTQQGILSALNQFMNANTTVPADADVNPGASRTPVMVLMSDGKPTAATYEYTNGNKEATMGSNTESIRSAAESDFLTQLTAAYAREMMDAHYDKEKPLFYTLSLGENENLKQGIPKISYDVMDPVNTLGNTFSEEQEEITKTISGYWDSLLSSGSITLTYEAAIEDYGPAVPDQECIVEKTTVKDPADTGSGELFPSSKSQMDYVDKAFEAENAGELAKAFENIYQEINLKSLYYPTLVGEDDDENLDGYVSFVDKIGKYMNVTDVKGILLGNSWYSGAEFAAAMDNGEFGTITAPTDLGNNFVWAIQKRLGISDVKVARDLISAAASPDAGQLSYDNDTGAYSNYIGWYADSDGNYLGTEKQSGWWDGKNTDRPDWDTDNKVAYAVKSYAYLGEIDKAQGITESDMMYTVVQVRTDIETGEETVVFEVPAALIPVVQYKIALKENGKIDSLGMSGAEKPIRLVYEVALNDEVTEKTIYDSSVVDQDYAAANTDDEGYVSFYTNQYEVSGGTGWGMLNTYAYFNPSYENDNYYYQEDTQIYTKENETFSLYKGSKEPKEVAGTYYRALKTYEYKDGQVKKVTTYRQLSSEALEAAKPLDKQPDANSTWYVPKGTVRMNKDYYNIEKNPNETKTLDYADVSHAFYQGEELVIGDTLGNNGRVKLKPVSGIKLSKSLAKDAKADENTEFTFVIQPADSSLTIDESKDYTAILVSKDGTETQKTVKFNNQKATVTLKADESIYITGLQTGKYQITENETAKYLLSSIEVNDTKITEDKATVNVSGNTLSDVEFTNVKTDGQTSQTVMIKKILENPSGSLAVSLAGYTFSLYECDSSYKITNPTAKLTSEATGDSGETSVSLDYKYSDIKDKLKNSEDGTLTYYYKLKENASGITNMTDSAAEYNFAVKVSAVDGVDSGKITSDIITSGEGWSEYSAGSSQQEIAAVYKLANFTNKYSPAEATVSINAEKKISGRDLKAGEFSFSIDALTEGAPVPARTTENNDADGNVNFGSIAFSKTGEYKYKIYENSTEEGNGVTIDEAVYTVSVKVSDETDADGKFTGKLKADMTIAKDNAVTDKIIFNNTYKPASTDITISGTKELTGLLLTEGRFGFTLAEADENGNVKEGGMVKNATNKADGTFAFDKITYKKAGTYYYVISENIPESSAPKYGIVYDEAKYLVTVKVTDNEKGSLVAEQQITKLAKSDDSDASGNTAAESIKFVNNYIPAEASAQINGTKDLDGAELKADQFSFTLYKADENWNKGEKVETVSNAKDGSFKFSELKFACDTTKLIAGQDYEEHYYYIIEEENAGQTIDGVTYDSRTVGVEVTVTDNKTGNLSAELSYYDLSQPIYDGENAGGDSDGADGNAGNGAELIGYTALTEAGFHNSYEVSGEADVHLDGTKYLEGRKLKENEFTFVLTDESGEIIQTVQNNADGSFGFDLKYTVEDVGNTYEYLVKEAAGALDGVKYDSTEYKVIVKVEDNGVGGISTEVKVKKGLFTTDNIVFKNVYENPKDGGAKTGDDSGMLPFAATGAAALAGIIAILLRRKSAR